MVAHLDAIFPALRGKNYQITSPPTMAYNCLVWAAGITAKWWWPQQDAGDTWPDGVSAAETVAAFSEAFATLGNVMVVMKRPVS